MVVRQSRRRWVSTAIAAALLSLTAAMVGSAPVAAATSNVEVWIGEAEPGGYMHWTAYTETPGTYGVVFKKDGAVFKSAPLTFAVGGPAVGVSATYQCQPTDVGRSITYTTEIDGIEVKRLDWTWSTDTCGPDPARTSVGWNSSAGGIMEWIAHNYTTGPLTVAFKKDGAILKSVTVNPGEVARTSYECQPADVGKTIVGTIDINGVPAGAPGRRAGDPSLFWVSPTTWTWTAERCVTKPVSASGIHGFTLVDGLQKDFIRFDVSGLVDRAVTVEYLVDGRVVGTRTLPAYGSALNDSGFTYQCTPSDVGNAIRPRVRVEGVEHHLDWNSSDDTTWQALGCTPVAAPAPAAPVAAPAPAAPVVAVKVKAKDRKSKLYVNVNPNKGKGFWKFKVQKQRASGTWKTWKKTYKTRGKAEKRKLNLKKGTYRVKVKSKYGYRGTTSASVYLKR